MDYAVILAGGSGTRLWPLSRRGMPKQLLPLIEGRSLLQLAFDRAATLVDTSHIVVCAGQDYADVITGQLPQLLAENLLLEPMGRDSLPGVAWSVATLARRDPHAVVAVLTADHIMTPQAGFTTSLREALSAAAEDPDAFVTCGVVPTSAHTGYGYLHVGEPVNQAATVFRVATFAEKPSQDRAQGYVDEGGWWWNSGMFCFRADTFMDQLACFQPEMAASIDVLVSRPDLVNEIYPQLTKVSMDYGLMEHISAGTSSARILTVPLQAQWSDIGGYPALADFLRGEGGNTVEGLVITEECADSLILNRTTDGRLVAVCGLKDVIIVEDGDITLVCSMDQAEKIKQVAQLARERGKQYA
ncbi:MAG: sugar phosphate nucleotidyltransferase [Propionibacteriaceae bacterium]|nr:sugar phosphate nucleotidyltransferase [Propionibacteriaceae bacterium]